ncbi:HAMP domain-containing histidine kinase [Erysipelothrix sp. HDW6C]|uniref:sensor histidine kinase n=1 Tax=Erysipelothrix sp. HDW6C TaxID=2714930 RepID=UPI00140C73BF|nr:HAMP domain-containing sensor histidine kinase [Erysipelothrix sp. HDW6C]QIK70590.1 HAMP domain-containing histidine kinase [Erysipelothrix sp. HDW6C]
MRRLKIIYSSAYFLMIATLLMLLYTTNQSSANNDFLLYPTASSNGFALVEGGTGFQEAMSVQTTADTSQSNATMKQRYILTGLAIGGATVGFYLLMRRLDKGKAEQAVETLDEASYKRLHSYLSHEQKNTLAILSTHLEQNHDAAGLKYIATLRDTVDDVLTLSDERQDETLECIDVVLIGAEVCDSYRENAEVNFEFDDTALIMGKDKWLYRALTNIVDNALKYSRNEPVNLSVKTQNNSVIIKVEDTGIGIKEDELEAIFGHKVRLNDLKSDGYGIGLSLVNHVCDLCNGVVWVESEIGVGTSVYLSFPEALTLD